MTDLSDAKIYGFEPLDWQRGFIECTKREVLGSGAFGSGKSRALGEKMLLLMTLYPGNKGLLARNTLKSLKNTTLEAFKTEVLPSAWIVEDLCNKQKQVIAIQSPYYPASYCPRDACGFESDRRVHTETVSCPSCGDAALEAVPASLLYYDGLQTTDHGEIPENILSLELGAIGVDECKDVTEGAWQALNGRLRHRDLNNPYVPELPIRTIFGTTNPAGPNHWLYRRFFEKDSANRAVFQSKTADNTVGLDLDEYLETLEEQYGEGTTEAQRLIEGEWVGYEGLVYDEWDDTIHHVSPLDVEETFGGDWSVVNTDELVETRSRHSNPCGDPSKPGQYTPARVYPPNDTPIVMSIDWGYRPDPLVVQWWAVTDTHGFVLYRSWMKTKTLPGEAAAEVVDAMDPFEFDNIRRVYADHDPGSHKQWIEGARDHVEDNDLDKNWRRLQTTNAKKDREAGVSEVKRALHVDSNGRAGLYVIRGNRCHQPDRALARDEKPTTFVDELRGYSYADEESGDPQDYDDHMMDCARYAVYTYREQYRGGGTGGSVIVTGSNDASSRRRKQRR